LREGETYAMLLIHVSDFGSPSSMPGWSTIYIWALWWTKWHWDSFFVRVLRFYSVRIPPMLLTHTPTDTMSSEHLTAYLTLILLTWRIRWAPNNASWQMGFNSAFKGL